MTTQLIVVEDAEDWDFEGITCPVVDVDDYLTSEKYLQLKNAQVINLCKGHRYLSVAYYCSLLAEARHHRVIPSVKTLLDLSSKAMYSLDTSYLDDVMQKGFKKSHLDPQASEFEMTVFFGHCEFEPMADLARQLFETFPSPLLNVRFERTDKWRVDSIRPLSLSRIEAAQRPRFLTALSGYLKKRWRSPRGRTNYRYDLAILHNPNDPMPPSNKRALQGFVKAGRELGMDVDLIERADYSRLAEYDALFIRDTTRINHYTYRFAKKAESEGMVVIDDPHSILRCTNKVYMAELLRSHRVPAPKTVIVGRNDLDATERAIGYPLVLKVPDGSFSQGVFKVENREQFQDRTQQLFKTSELILAQEFLYTEFDWRIGILNRKPIYACQYFMSKKHWQIVHYQSDGRATEGAYRTLAIEQAPFDVVSIALKAANLIGDGLYGVDLKQGPKGIYVIEINDNPSIEAGVEDGVLKDRLYLMIMGEFIRRLDLRHGRENHGPG